MKKYFVLVAVTLAALVAVSCDRNGKEPEKPGTETEPTTPPDEGPKTADLVLQLVCAGQNFAVEGVAVDLSDAAGTFSFNATTNAEGKATFTVTAGSYTASTTYKTVDNGKRLVYNGANTSITVAEAGAAVNAEIALNMSESQQIIIKELYSGGCDIGGGKSFSDDAYVVLYNNSEFEADATDIQFTFAAPYNAHGTNKYRTDDGLLFENADWIPAYGAIWWFTQPVKIPAYSQVVVAIFGAIDHTATYTNSVDLSNPEYYWMSNTEVAQYDNGKYVVSEAIPQDHYLTCSPFTQGKAWTLSNICPAFYIGKASKEEGLRLSTDTENYDHTMGTSAAMNVVKYPKANVIDAVEVWSAANLSKSAVRFPADINTGYVSLTNKLGYSIYRNVDKEATEALAENKDKLVYNYAGGTDDVEGSTDPSGIDAEASIAAGAHIIYSDTNDSSKDFHQRKTAALKK